MLKKLFLKRSKGLLKIVTSVSGKFGIFFKFLMKAKQFMPGHGGFMFWQIFLMQSISRLATCFWFAQCLKDSAK